MKWLLCMVGLTLALAPCAAADVPAGFVSHPELASRVQFLVDHPIGVYCATSDDAWTQATAGRRVVDYAAGFAPFGGDAMYLVMSSCRAPLQKLAGQPFSWDWLARNLLTLSHEAEHLAGHVDEHETDCAALAAIRQVAWNFGIHKGANLARIQGDALSIHTAMSPPYGGPC